MSGLQHVYQSEVTTVFLAVLNVVQVVFLAHISSRSTRVRQSDNTTEPPAE